MAKRDNVFKQSLPGLFVSGKHIPRVAIDGDFIYLGKLFNFEVNANTSAKNFIYNKLKELLTVTGKFKVRPQTKLKILKLYIHAQLVFYLKAYDLPLTWIENMLDALCEKHVRDWLETPISSCVSEMQRLPANRTGLGIPSFKDVAEKTSLKKRYAMRNGQNPIRKAIWEETSVKMLLQMNLSITLRL